MKTSLRFVPVLVSLLASACGSDDPSQVTPDDDAATHDDGGAGDDRLTTVDLTMPQEASGDVNDRDAGGRSDGGGRADGATGSDAGTRGDGATRVDGGNVLDATTIDTPSADARNDGVIRVDATSDAPRTTDGAIPTCLGAIDTEFLREKLSKLSGAMPVQIGGMDTTIPERNSAASRGLARQFLTAEYQTLGFTVTEHTYATGTNLVASRAGADSKFLILSAHYDSIRDTVAGADDDGSGVIGGLAAAKALQGCQLEHGVRILAFDEEEDGLVGSRAYVSQLQSSGDLADLIGDVQLEMLGYHTKQDGGFLLVDCKSQEGDRPESKFLNDAVLNAIARGSLPLEPHDSCTSSSDHSPFWTAGKPAIVFSQEFFFSGADSTPCYHKDCDKVDQINFDYFTKLTTLGAFTVADLLGAH